MATTSKSNPSEQQDVYLFPTSFAQQRLWLLDQLDPHSPAYNILCALRISTLLDVHVLEQSLNALIQRHEVLRTTFVAKDGQPMQRILPTLRPPLTIVDLQHLPERQREREVMRLANEEAQRPFDLAQGPLLRITLLQLGTQEYLLLVIIHHIIFDGWSVDVFFRELAEFYLAFANGQFPALPELPIQYGDFAVWQRERLQGEQFEKELAYWKKQLAGAPAALELPTDRPRPSVPTHQGSIHFFNLSRPLTDALKALSRQEGVSLFMLLVTAFQTLLYRYIGQDDLLLGTVTADRSQVETEQLIGFFVNTLVLRTDLSGNPTFRDLVGRLREVILEAHAHQDVPFEYLVKELHPDRSLGQNPIFQVMLVFEPSSPALPAGWDILPLEVKTGAARFDLYLELYDRPDGLRWSLEYSSDLFEEATIVRLVGHWQTLLEGIVAHPEQRITDLPLLTKFERQRLLIDWNDTCMDHPKEQCVHHLFEVQVERTPEAVALIYEEQQLTYRELNARANQLAHHLCQLGVGPEVRVGLCVERSLEMVVGLLGILKAGGAYVPLDPAYPSERLAYMLEDAQASVLLTQQHLTAHQPNGGAKVVCLDTDRALLDQQSEANVASPVTSAHLAYVIYTSGSTGRPKGVQILHRAVVNFLLSMRQQPGLTSQDSLLAITTLSFDIAALELFLPLIVGARIIVASHAVVTSGLALAEVLTHAQPTVMQATPVTWRLLLLAGWQGTPGLKMLCGGEALPLELAQQLLPKGAALWNLYGPTETTIWSTVCQVEAEDKWVSIGRPIANTQVYILDGQLQPLPIGIAGELYIGGDGLARGYLNRPELTAEKFISYPFSDEPDTRLYKTGDLARYRSNGTIEHLGRLDHQVKIRGFRIELGEIEAVLLEHQGVQQAVVVAREDKPGDKRLVAYVVVQEGQSITSADLQEHAMKHLPTYMLPGVFVFLKVLPLTTNNKVDRRALPAPEANISMREASFVAPALPVHHELTQIWEELLEARPIGIRDSFFELGGHSLLAARLVHRIEQVWGKRISLAALLAGPTIERLADALLPTEDGFGSPPVTIQAGGFQQPTVAVRKQVTSSVKTAWAKLKLKRGAGSRNQKGETRS